MWGCADATAQRWWRAGCRTLDDVRQRLGSELTAQQRIGLRYFDDFAVRTVLSGTAIDAHLWNATVAVGRACMVHSAWRWQGVT